MNWILRLIPLPFLIFLGGLACLAAAGAHVFYELEKSKALEAGLPPTLAAGQLGEVKEFPWYEEVVVEAQIADDLTYVYWEEWDTGTIEYPVLFFFDPNHTGPVREVLGAISFETSTEAQMNAYLDSVYQGEGEHGSIYRLVGTPAWLPEVSSDEIEWAAYDLNVSMSENFLHLDPYFQGRGARLEPQPMLGYIAAGLGFGLIWLAMIAQIIKRRLRLARAEREMSAAGNVAKKGLLGAGAAVVGSMMDG